MEEKKKSVVGVYYELSPDGNYARHSNVRVHCDDEAQEDEAPTSQRAVSPAQREQVPQIHIKPSQFRLWDNEGPCSQMIEEQPSEDSRDRSRRSEEKQKGRSLAKSTNNGQTPRKKGIIKRSLVDCKELQQNRERVAQEDTVENPSLLKFHHLSLELNKESNKRKTLHSEYESMLQRLRSVSSEMEEDHVHENTIGQTMRIPSLGTGRQSRGDNSPRPRRILTQRDHLQKKPGLNSYRESPSRRTNNSQRSISNTRRLQTQSGQTVINRRQYQRRLDRQRAEQKILQQINFVTERLQALECEMRESEQRVVRFQIQRQLLENERQMKVLQRQNQQLKQQKIQQKKEEDKVFDMTLGELWRRGGMWIMAVLVMIALAGKGSSMCHK